MASTCDTAARPSAVTWAGLAVVSGSAAVLSFATVRDLALACGYPLRLAWLLPVVIDATAVVGSRIWLGSAASRSAIRYARALALAAAAVTIGANVLQHGLAAYHTMPPWWLVAALAAIPPTALVAVAHQVALLTRAHSVLDPVAGKPETSSSPAAARPGSRPVERATGDDGLAARALRVITATPGPVGRRRLARELDISEHQARQLLPQIARVTDVAAAPTPASSPTAMNGARQHV